VTATYQHESLGESELHGASQVLEEVSRNATRSIPELAAVCRHSPERIAAILGAFEHAGIIDQRSDVRSPATTAFALRRDAGYAVGIDLGGTKIAAAIANFAGEVLVEHVEPTRADNGDALIRQIDASIAHLCASAKIERRHVHALTLGVPGAVDPKTNAVSKAVNVVGLEGDGILARLSQALRLNIVLENDVNLAALGEASHRSAGSIDDLVFLSLGTGVGMGLIIGQKLIRGSTGNAGEIAYLPFGTELASSHSLKVGAFEALVGSAAIRERYQLKSQNDGAFSVEDIFRYAQNGDAAAISALKETAAWIARAIVSVHSLLDCECIVLGGSIGSQVYLLKDIEAEISQIYQSHVHLEISALGNRAGLYGAAHHAVSRLRNARVDEIFGTLDS
jgi:predicted NBD/HSP70 family sugar kinase